MNIDFDYREKRHNLKISKLNIIYAPSNEGKSMLLQSIEDGFNNKSGSGFYINGSNVIKGTYETIQIDFSKNIYSELKLTSKTLLGKIMSPIIDDFLDQEETELVFQEFDKIISKLNVEVGNVFESIFLSSNDLLKSEFSNDNRAALITSLFEYYFNDDNTKTSTSNSKKFFYQLLFHYLKKEEKQFIVLIDNFDSHFNEEYTIDFIKNLKTILSTNIRVILTSSNNNSFHHFYGNSRIYALRDDRLFRLDDLSGFMREAILDGSKENFTFEDVVINHNIVSKKEIENYINLLTPNLNNTLGKMITNKNYQILEKIDKNSVSILYNNELERKFLTLLSNYILLNDD